MEKIIGDSIKKQGTEMSYKVGDKVWLKDFRTIGMVSEIKMQPVYVVKIDDSDQEFLYNDSEDLKLLAGEKEQQEIINFQKEIFEAKCRTAEIEDKFNVLICPEDENDEDED